ncbi:MAG: Ig-like domain-containing protein [Chitinophagales bacterium]
MVVRYTSAPDCLNFLNGVLLNTPPCSQPPVAVDDNDTTAMGIALITNVISNDTDPDNDLNPASVDTTAGGSPSNGTLTLNGDGTVTYTPNTNFAGDDQFEYVVCDSTSPTPLCDTAIVFINVTAQSPVAVDDNDTTTLNTDVTTNVVSNDTDADNGINPASVDTTDGGSPSNGSLTLNGDGTVTYTPNTNFVGDDQFEYVVCDSTSPTPLCDTATVFVNITGQSPVAVDDNDTTTLNTAVTTNVVSNDTDADNGINPASVDTTAGGSQTMEP